MSQSVEQLADHGGPLRSPSGAWAIGVSGGADSVALLAMLRGRPGLRLHVAHLDHQLRGDESAGDAQFVRELATRWALPATIATRAEVEPQLTERPANPSALYRALRLKLFHTVVRDHGLAGVLLAHHADDQAETILHQLLRGAAPAALRGMQARSVVGELEIARPLLRVRRDALREYLRKTGQPWREDSSNASDAYERNRLRRVLAGRDDLVQSLLELGDACGRWGEWLAQAAPDLPESFGLEQARRVHPVLLKESLRRWLIARGAPPGEVGSAEVARLWSMIDDAASPSRQDFAGRISVRRRAGAIAAEAPGGARS